MPFVLVSSLTSPALLHNGSYRNNSTDTVKSAEHKSSRPRIPHADVTTQGDEVGGEKQVGVVILVASRCHIYAVEEVAGLAGAEREDTAVQDLAADLHNGQRRSTAVLEVVGIRHIVRRKWTPTDQIV